MDKRILNNLLFQGLSNEVARDLDIQIDECRFGKGKIIFEEGEPGSHLYLVFEGQVRISKKGRQGKQETLSIQSAEDFFGELSLIDNRHRSARATAVSDVVLGKINKEEIERYLSHSSENARRFARRVSTQLRNTNSVFIEKLIETERLSLLGTMMAGIVHDFRNPIATLGMLSHYLRAHEDPVLKDLGNIAEDSIDRMKLMIRELLDFSRGESNLDLKPTSLKELTGKLDQQIFRRVEGSGVKVVREIEFDGLVTVDKDRLQRLLENIIKNAWEAMDSDGQLIFRVFRIEDSIEFQIQDTGHGIPPEILARIFEPFVTHGKSNGTGLGMAIAKSVVEAHSGQIWIESVMNQGTTCYIRIPHRPSESK